MENERELTGEELERKQGAKEKYREWVLLEETSWRQKSRFGLRRVAKIHVFPSLANAHQRRNHIAKLNRALLAKWSWRFAVESGALWNDLIMAKYGEQEGGWCSGEVRDGFGVGVWKAV